MVYENVSVDKWPFENYYKALNYFSYKEEGAFSKLEYYELAVTH